MTAHLDAIGEPHLWTPINNAQNIVLVRHPNGAELCIVPDATCWFIRPRPAPNDVKSLRRLAMIPRTARVANLDGMVQDTLRVAGPEARACMHRLLVEIQLWALQHAPSGGSLTLHRHAIMAMFLSSHSYQPLPDPLCARWKAAKHILTRTADQTAMATSKPILLDLPATAHGALALRAHYQDLVSQETPHAP